MEIEEEQGSGKGREDDVRVCGGMDKGVLVSEMLSGSLTWCRSMLLIYCPQGGKEGFCRWVRV